MGDFMGSYFLETDEDQLGRDIQLHEEEKPVPVVSIGDIEAEEKHKPEKKTGKAVDFSFDPAEEHDEDFPPIATATMSSLEPSSMMSIHLTKKGSAHFNIPDDWGMTKDGSPHDSPQLAVTPRSAKELLKPGTPTLGGGLVQNVFGRFRKPGTGKEGPESTDPVSKSRKQD